jgi:chromosome segregation ATPase
MRKALNKFRSNSEVLDVLDAAGELDHAEDRSLDTSLAAFGPAFRSYVQELPAYLRNDISAIGDAARGYINPFNETYSHRKIKPGLKALQANATAYSHMRERAKELEQKVNSSRASAEKKKATLERAQATADHVKSAEAQVASRIANEQLERDEAAFNDFTEKLEREGVAYRKKVIDLLTTPIEKMAESRKATLVSVLDTGAQISRIALALAFQEEDQTSLEQQLEIINTELEEMG